MALTPVPQAPNDIDGDDNGQQKGAAAHDTADYGGHRFPLVTISHSVGGVRRKHLHIRRGCATEPIVGDAFGGAGAWQVRVCRD